MKTIVSICMFFTLSAFAYSAGSSDAVPVSDKPLGDIYAAGAAGSEPLTTKPADKKAGDRMLVNSEFAADGPLFARSAQKPDTFKSVPELRKLGKIVKETASTEADSYAQYPFTIVFDGLEIAGDRSSPGNTDEGRVCAITVTKSKWKIKHGLTVGAHVNKLTRVLGQPQEEGADGAKVYHGESSVIRFFAEKNRISKIFFGYHCE